MRWLIHLSVTLPDSYQTSTQAYPVIYVLDGDYHFGVAAGLTRYSNVFRQVPELIIVGIGYDMETSDEWVQLRDLDFDIPGMPGASSDSGANLFLDALTQEIIPFFNANYRTIPSDRCLQGYLLSGIFVLYALFQQPDAFQRYISGSAMTTSHAQRDPKFFWAAMMSSAWTKRALSAVFPVLGCSAQHLVHPAADHSGPLVVIDNVTVANEADSAAPQAAKYRVGRNANLRSGPGPIRQLVDWW